MPVDLLDAFINYHKTGSGVAWFDEEGTEFTLVLTPYSMFIIEEKDGPVLHDFSEIKIIDVEKELIKDIEENLTNWAKEFVTGDGEEEWHVNRHQIRNRLSTLKEYVTKMDNNSKYIERE